MKMAIELFLVTVLAFGVVYVMVTVAAGKSQKPCHSELPPINLLEGRK